MSNQDNIQQLFQGHEGLPPLSSANETSSSFQQYMDMPKRYSEPIQIQREDYSAIPFIKFTPSEGKFEMNPEASEFLQSLQGIKLGVVAVCGKYRTGKSYLLNKLFVETYMQQNQINNNTLNATGMNVNSNNQTSPRKKFSQDLSFHQNSQQEQRLNQTLTPGFQVSPTINPCTKGLWLWKKVVYSDQNECPMIVIDTEGLGAFDEDENHDAKIFLLALLLSSLIIYNSVGTIDETALNNLSLVINLSKKIQLRNKEETPEDIDELASYFPSFLWVLRDFTLKLVDAEGNRISSKQYLENALKEQKGCSESVEQKNRIRRLLKHFFRERDCCTLIRPTERERDLQDLAKSIGCVSINGNMNSNGNGNGIIENQQNMLLRKDFVDQINRLKQKVMTKIKVKVMNGHQLNGPMILELANSYIEALNQGQVPNIENAWTNVCSFEQERAFKESVKYFESEVKLRLKNCFEDIGQGNVKSLLNTIRDESVHLLRSKFLGDQSQSEVYEKKLLEFIKKETKVVVKETQKKIDEQITQQVTILFQDQIEHKARQSCEDLSSLQHLSEELDHILTVLQIRFVNDTERAEHLLRKYVLSHNRLFRVIEMIWAEGERKLKTQVRLLEERLNIKELAIQQYKEEKKELQSENQIQNERNEQERLELVRVNKMLEQKLRMCEQKLQEQEKQLLHFKNKDFKNAITQTVQKQTFNVQVDSMIQTIDQNISKKYITDDQDYIQIDTQQDQSPFIYDQPLKIQQKQQKSQSSNTQQQSQPALNQSQLFKDIVLALNQQTKQIQDSMGKELNNLVRANETMARAVEKAEKRANTLEKKLEKKSRYEELIKNCQRLQCNGCNKLYTPMLFVTHFMLCKKQQQLRSSIIQENLKIQEEQKEDSSSNLSSNNEEQQFLAKIVDMKQIQIDLRPNNRIMRASQNIYKNQNQYEVLQNSDEMVTIMNNNNNNHYTNFQMHQCSQNSYQTVEFKFCVLYKGSIWYVYRSLLKIKEVMNKIQRDKYNNENEQCQIAKWLLEIERNELEENYQRIADIIETFFAMIYRKLVLSKKSSLEETLILKYPKIKVENVEDYQQKQKRQETEFNFRDKRDFIQEFIEFFEIEQNLNQRPQHWANIQPIQNNDDDIVVQMTYDDNEHNKTESEINIIDKHSRSSAMGGTAISDLCLNQRTQGGFRMTTSANGYANGIHSTMHLDGERSVNDNSSLHFVSFFSVAEELLMKKNLLLASSQPQSQQDNYEIIEYEDEESANYFENQSQQPQIHNNININGNNINNQLLQRQRTMNEHVNLQQKYEQFRNDENYVTGSPTKSQRRRQQQLAANGYQPHNQQEVQPFYPISNRQSTYRNNNPDNLTKAQTFIRPSISPLKIDQNYNKNQRNEILTSKRENIIQQEAEINSSKSSNIYKNIRE